MLVVMSVQATPEQVANVIKHVRERGFEPIELPGADRLAIGILGSNPGSIRDAICDLPGVVDAIPVSKPYKQVTREWHPEPDCGRCVRRPDRRRFTGRHRRAVRRREPRAVLDAAPEPWPKPARRCCAAAPSSRARSPYAFQGLGRRRASSSWRRRAPPTGLPVVTEVMDAADVELVAEYADMLQIGARNMQNFALLEAVGAAASPVLLKRGLCRHHRGVAAGGRVHRGARQPERHPLRARHPHLRDRHPQHARPQRGAGGQGADPPAGHRRPQSTAPAHATLVAADGAGGASRPAPTG